MSISLYRKAVRFFFVDDTFYAVLWQGQQSIMVHYRSMCLVLETVYLPYSCIVKSIFLFTYDSRSPGNSRSLHTCICIIVALGCLSHTNLYNWFNITE